MTNPTPQSDPRSSGRNKPPFPKQEQSGSGRESEMDPPPDYGLDSYRGLGRLRDRVAIITGGDSGIGRAVALAFAREGADVAIVYLEHDQDAEVSAQAVRDAGRRALTLRADLAVDKECERVVREVVAKFEKIDILVNNAARQDKAVDSFEQLTRERVEGTFRTNILAMFSLVHYALPHLKPGATIINTASIQAYKPSSAILDYAVTKGAIVTFTKGLSESLLERGIRVNCVAPGPVWTPIVVSSFDADQNAKFGQDSPLGRPAQPAELAPSFVFLACEESRYISGEILGVTGGKPLP
jgi:NAD(P)-dependent dehydrogenase (short-subunit alcohol dehydrogenase family)